MIIGTQTMTTSTPTVLTLNWSIPNFPSLTRKNEHIVSEPFTPSAAFNFKLRIYPNGFSEADKGTIIFLHFTQSDAELKQVNLLYRFALLDSYGVKCCIKEQRGTFIRDCQFGFPEYIRRVYLLDPANRLLPGGTLTLLCELHLTSDPFGFSSFANHQKIVQDYVGLLHNGKGRDITFEFPNESGRPDELCAHMDILSARSAVFAAMFTHESTKEVLEKRVVIKDAKVAVFQELLRYLYVGIVQQLEQFAEELLAESDKYDIPDLKAECEEYLCSRMDIELASNLLYLADMCNCPKLKSSVTDFFHNNAAKIKKTKACEKLTLTRPDLFRELYFNLASKTPDTTVNET